MQYISSLLLLLLIIQHEEKSVSGLLPYTALDLLGRRISSSKTRTCSLVSDYDSTTAKDGDAAQLPDLYDELRTVDLELCHGILHASGVRRLVDLKDLTDDHIVGMGADNLDRRNMVLARAAPVTFQQQQQILTTARNLSTNVDGAFRRVTRDRFATEERHDFCFEPICGQNEVFKGRFLTVEQCEQLVRMAEYSAYRGIETIGAGWTNEVYTLTAQHMLCKDIPGVIPTTRSLFSQLFQELYHLFGDRIRPGTIEFESDREPHLVKYCGKAKGTELHTDNSEYVYITINVALSAKDDYAGGGTFIPKLDQTIRLKQGEMLVHLGDLEHAGAEITGGVRHILIAFLACEWKEDSLNQAKRENARDYVPPT